MAKQPPPQLARECIRARRLEVGLSERDVAAHWGVSAAVVRNVETGRVAADLSLGQLAKLGAILSLDVGELLDTCTGEDDRYAARTRRTRTLPWSAPSSPTSESSSRRGTCRSTGVGLDRTRAALADLDVVVRSAGMRVHRLHHDVRIARTVTTVDPQTLEGLWRIHLARRSITSARARPLRHICDGAVDLGNTKDTHKVRLPELRNAGLIEAEEARAGTSAAWQPTDAVRFSLLLDELPATRDVAAPAKTVPAHRAALRET